MNFHIKYNKVKDLVDNEYHLFDLILYPEFECMIVNISFRTYDLECLEKSTKSYLNSTNINSIACDCFIIKNNELSFKSTAPNILTDIHIKERSNINKFLQELLNSIKTEKLIDYIKIKN